MLVVQCTMNFSEVFDATAIIELFNNCRALSNVVGKLSFFKSRITQIRFKGSRKRNLTAKKKQV